MKNHPITLVMQEAPADPFDPRGAQLYRLVAQVPRLDVEVSLTAAHDDPCDALLDAFSDGMDARLAAVEAEVSAVAASGADHDRLLGALGAAIDGQRERCADTMRGHTAAYRHKQK